MAPFNKVPLEILNVRVTVQGADVHPFSSKFRAYNRVEYSLSQVSQILVYSCTCLFIYLFLPGTYLLTILNIFL